MADRKLVAIFDAVMTPWQRAMYEATQSQRKWEVASLSSFGRVEKGLGGLMSSASKLTAVSALLAGGFGAGMATRFLDQSARIHNALKQIGADNQDTFDQVYLASNRALVGMEDFTSSVQRIQKVMGDKQGVDVAIRQMETLNKLMALGGKTTQERMSTMRQFAQAVQKGTLNSDELVSLRENAPAELLTEIARLAGGTTMELGKMAEAGQLTRDVMLDALNNLADGADKAMGQVRIAISDAAEIMRNGAIRASEGFDKGLGFSRATVATLKTMGDLLGSNAEAAQRFGAAINILIPLLAAAFVGRRVNRAGTALFGDWPAERAQILATAKAAVDESRVVVAAKIRQIAAIREKIAVMQVEGAAATRIAAAERQLIAATQSLGAATVRSGKATVALAAAQDRMLFSTRALTAAGGALRSAWAFLGGWPGLLLIAGTALLTMKDNAEKFADTMARIDEASSAVDDLAQRYADTTASIIGDTSKLEAANKRVEDAIRAQAPAAQDVASLEAQAIDARINKNKELLQSITDLMRIRLVEAQEAQKSAEKALMDEFAPDPWLANQALDPSVSDIRFRQQNLDMAVQMARDAMVFNNATKEQRQLLEENAQIEQRSQDILAMQAILQATISGEVVKTATVTEEVAAATEKWEAPASRFFGLVRAGVTDLDTLVGKEGSVVSAFNNMASAAGGISGALQSAFGWMSGLAAGIRQMAVTGSAGMDPRVDLPVGSMPKAPNVPLSSPTPPNRPWWEPGTGGAVATGGGSSGGGSSRANKDDEEALRIIESMMTAEEKRAEEMTNMLALRGRLAATYGEESDLVKRLDEAILRTSDSLKTANDELTQFFDTMSNEIASNILEWKGWDNFLRSTLASLVRQFGPEFFTAIFTPGAQTGGGLGTIIGNLVTGGKSSLPAAALSGRIRAPAGAKMASSTINIVHHNDFRGADPSMKVWVERQLTKRDREFHPRVVNAIRNARSKRELQ